LARKSQPTHICEPLCIIQNKIMKPSSYIALLIALTIFISISCNKKKSTYIKDSQVIIAGAIEHYKNYPNNLSIKIIIYDLPSGKIKNHLAYIQKDGKIRFTFEKTIPQDIYLIYGEQQIILCIHPGDSLFIEFDAHEFFNTGDEEYPILKTLKFSGNACVINQEILSFLPMYSKIQPSGEENMAKAKMLSSAEYKNYVLNQWEEDKKILKSYITDFKPSKTFKKWAKYYIDYSIAYSLMSFSWDNAYLNKQEEALPLPEGYYDFIDKFKLNQKGASICSIYEMYLRAYGRYIQEKIKEEYEPDRKAKDYLSMYRKTINNIINQTTGFTRDLLLTQKYFLLLEAKWLDIFKELYPIYQNTAENEIFKDKLSKEYKKVKILVENPVISDRSKLTDLQKINIIGNIFDTIINKHQGKVLYIDVWATWCGPCREEMPFSIKLQGKFKNNEVAFIYLCTRSSKDNWKATISELNITGDHYNLNNNQSNVLSEKFKISGVPHYILVDNKGNIINENAKRPSSVGELNADLIKEINSLLNE